MAAVDLAAKRYALAAFEIAKEQGNAEAWAQALDEMAAFMTRPDVMQMLENTRADQAEKMRLIEAGLNMLPPLTLNLARLLVRKGRASLVGDIVTEFKALLEDAQGLVHARAVTAVALSGLERDGLARRIEQQTGRRVILETEVDPNILGGVIVQIGDRLFDASTRARLEALRETLAGSIA